MRTLADVRGLIPLADEDMVPPPDLFLHHGTLHGQPHVARVLVHALRLIAATGLVEEAPRLWASVYLHDIARRHDGHCAGHGAEAWERLGSLPDVRVLFARGGVVEADYPAIEAAVALHSRGEAKPGAPEARLTRLLKDADGLDRVRLGDLDPGYLRHPEARGMIRFAQRLYGETDHKLPVGPDYFARLWPLAQRLAVQVPDHDVSLNAERKAD
jgi:hypothetical protein